MLQAMPGSFLVCGCSYIIVFMPMCISGTTPHTHWNNKHKPAMAGCLVMPCLLVN